MGAKLQRFLNDEGGSATIEFVVVFPFLMFFMMLIVETGFLATRMVMLERGVDIAVRSVRLGQAAAMTHDSLKDLVCENAGVLVNCKRDLVLEVVELDLSSAYPQNQANCIDRTGEIDPTINFTPGGRNRIMFVRACMVVDPVFPGLGITLGLHKDSTGGLQMVAYSAFMNEPA